MRVRLRDVADRAGVSVKTVSNVVNGYVHVAPSTRARVQAVLNETGYRPNLSARNLRTGRAGVIALALPELTNPYFSELAGHVVEAADEQGWTVLVDQTDGLRERELEVARGFRQHVIDGLILSPHAVGFEDLVTDGSETGGRRVPGHRDDAVPLVLLGEKLTSGPTDHVAIDNVTAARAATEHLLSLGRRRVAVVGHQPESEVSSGVARLRRRGWAEALEAAGLSPDDSLLGEVEDFSRAEGVRAMADLLDRGVEADAVLCFSDVLAVGVLRLLADRGLAVPGDVAVIGIDDIPESRFTVPRLSTVAPDKRAIARDAVAMLAERLEPGGRARAPRDVRAAFQLVPRESTVG